MIISARRTNAPTTTRGRLATAERTRSNRLRPLTATTPLPAQEVAIPAPRSVRWGQGPLLDALNLQCSADPRDLHRQRRS